MPIPFNLMQNFQPAQAQPMQGQVAPIPPVPAQRQVRNARTGEVAYLPANATDEDVHNYFSAAKQQAQQPAQSFAPIAQTFLNGLQQMNEPASTLPGISGRAMIGLAPEQAQSVLGMAQQSNQDNLRKRLEQQRMVQQQMEQEKDRQQQLKLEQQRLKNAIDQAKLEQETARAKAEFEVQLKELQYQNDLDVENVKETNRTKREEFKQQRPLVAGGNIVTPDGRVIFSAPKDPKEPKAVTPVEIVKTRAFNNETGKMEDVQKIFYSDGTSEFMPLPSQTEGGTRGSRGGRGGREPNSGSVFAVLNITPEDSESMINARVRNILAGRNEMAKPGQDGYIDYQQAYEIATADVEENLLRGEGFPVLRIGNHVYWVDPADELAEQEQKQGIPQQEDGYGTYIP